MEALLLPALTTALANALLRALLHASRAFSRGESSSRACAALCSALVCLHTLRAGELAGASSYCGYLVADTLGALLLGPALRPEILAHHLGTGALCLLGALRFSERSAGAAGGGGALALAAPTAPLARALLLMEASNPFLHAAWVAQKEEALRGARWAVLPWAVPGALAAFLWFRVLEGARALQYALGLGGVLGAWLAPVAGGVALLWGLQVYWYALLCRAVLAAAWPWVAAAAPAGKRRA